MEYRNAALDLLKTFEKYELIFIPRAQNHLANELAFTASNWQIPQTNEQSDIKVKNKPAILDNEDYWQVFEGDKHIDDFLQSKNDFAIPTSTSSHEKNCLNEEKIPEIELFK